MTKQEKKAERQRQINDFITEHGVEHLDDFIMDKIEESRLRLGIFWFTILCVVSTLFIGVILTR